jgi:hypothetical protein
MKTTPEAADLARRVLYEWLERGVSDIQTVSKELSESLDPNVVVLLPRGGERRGRDDVLQYLAGHARAGAARGIETADPLPILVEPTQVGATASLSTPELGQFSWQFEIADGIVRHVRLDAQPFPPSIAAHS